MSEKIKNNNESILRKRDAIPALYTKEKVRLHNLFFDRLISELDLEKIDGDIVAVLHMLPDAIPFTRALSKIANNIEAVIPITHAVSSGFNASNKNELLCQSDVLCLSTGNLSLKGDDYKKIKKGAWIFSVTSSDDELDKKWLENNYKREQISRHATKYSNEGHYFYILNNGNAINFIHGTTVGDFILLVHAELIASAYALLTGRIGKDTHELDEKTRDKICEIWLNVFKKKKESDKLLNESSELHDNAITSLRKYANTYPDENIDLLINYVERSPRSTDRTNTIGHLTASGLVVKDDKILLIYHNVLQRYLQPGGHLEKDDVSLYEAAKREVLEETGLEVEAHPLHDDSLVNVDVHKIPANNKKEEPEHSHYDCMFVFSPKKMSGDIKLQEEEVSDYQWVSFDYDFKDPGLKEVIRKIRKQSL